MNYLFHYNNLIKNRKENPLSNIEYGEHHHIIPRCMGGSDDKSNIVKLTAREHFIAHHLLFKAHRTAKLAHAWFMMLRFDPNQKRYFTSRQKEAAANAHSGALKETMKGSGNHFYGKSHTEESKLKVSLANKGRKKTKEEIENWVEKVAKQPKSKEHREKIGRPGLVLLKNKLTNESIRIPKEMLINYDLNIWLNPAKISQKRETCKYCNIESVSGNIKRWHNENCKHKAI